MATPQYQQPQAAPPATESPRMDANDKQFLATISQFKSQDFADSNHEETLALRQIFEEMDTGAGGFPPRQAPLAPPPVEQNQPAPQSYHQPLSFSYNDPFNMALSPIAQYPQVAQYPVQQSGSHSFNRNKMSYPPSSGGAAADWFDNNSGMLKIPPRRSFSNQSYPGAPQPQHVHQQPAWPYPRYEEQAPYGQHYAYSNSQQQHPPQPYMDAERSQGSKFAIPSVSPQSFAKRIKLPNGTEYITNDPVGPDPKTVALEPVPTAAKSRPKRRASRKKKESDGDSSGTTADSDNENGLPRFPASIHGETRLNISFTNRGTIGMIPQKFGKNNCVIPDGLSGTHQMYEQKWRFEIRHILQPDMRTVLIEWSIHNLTSGKSTIATETVQDALNRDSCGRTICNNVLKKALDARAAEIEESLKDMQDNVPRVSNMRNLVKVLRPKRCTVGLLFFGLLHEQIQVNMAKQLSERAAQEAMARQQQQQQQQQQLQHQQQEVLPAPSMA